MGLSLIFWQRLTLLTKKVKVQIDISCSSGTGIVDDTMPIL